MKLLQPWNALLTAVFLGGVFATSAGAQLPHVAIVAAPGSVTGGCQATDTQAKLMGTGLFSAVDFFNLQGGTPTLAQLQAWDSVLVFTNGTPTDSAGFGNVLADYVDAGGGVVVAVFANSTTFLNRNIGGRWQNTYEVIMDQSGNTTGHATLGTVLVPAHPVMAGVASFDGGTLSYRPTGTSLNAGATLIAQWSDGRVLVAAGSSPRRVDLGMYPPSFDCLNTSWLTATDGAKLMANALVFVAGGAPCPADADGNGSIEPADVATFVNRWFTSLTGGTLEGDFNGNGQVEPSDVAGFVNAWFQALVSGC